jgi:hypothetical protein
MEQSIGLSGLRPIQPRFNRIESGLPRTKASLQSQNSSSTFNLQSFKHYYKPDSNISKFIQTVFQTDQQNGLSKLTAGRKDYTTTHVAKVDTMPSPRPGVTQEGHCQPGTGPVPRTSQKEQTMAMQGCPWSSRKLYLKQILARLSILILSKAYPSLSIL